MENAQFLPSTRLFRPEEKALRAYHPGPAAPLADPARQMEQEIARLIGQHHYPCIAAITSYHRDDYRLGFYGELGRGQAWRELRQDLLFFLNEQKTTSSPYLTFWAVFDPVPPLSEEEFEQRLWRELSFLTSEEQKDLDWPADAPKDPADKKFCFSLGGEAFFVVGLHERSSRLSRRFPRPALVFNVFRQFQSLMTEGLYEPMVQKNRQRDVRFQGSANPMALWHGDDWESIQFSGRDNPPEWKCPFHFRRESEKP
ncbi:MAG: YqcI/YcgG family protein [Bdellovibrionaceae bacterium]|nr:YqcI/YcgG family protein [Pseudobdellovibrionaceae bacterium]